MVHGSVSVRGLVLDPPLVNGSGVVDVVSSSEEWNLPASQVSKLGAFVTKTVTRSARSGNVQPWAEVLGEGSLVNAAGLPNPGIDRALRDWSHLPQLLGIPVVMSLGGSPAELAELAGLVEAAGWVAAIELNLSCPNVERGLAAADPQRAEAAVAAARAACSMPLLAKLTPACGDPGAVAQAVVAAGADAITCGNTIPARLPSDDRAGVSGPVGGGWDGGLSGRALHPIALRLVADVAAAVDVPVVGLGGVDGVAAAARMRVAGAHVVGVGTGAVFDPGLIAQLARPVVEVERSGR